jgi:hypothetical protein
MSALDIERLRSQRLQEKQEKEIHAMLKVDVCAVLAIISTMRSCHCSSA